MPTFAFISRLFPVAFLSLFLTHLEGQETSGYNQPDRAILDVMHAPAPPRPFVSPTQDNILLVAQQEYPSIARVATPFLRLAGVRIEPANHSKHDTPGGYGITPCASSYQIVNIASTKAIHVELPAHACPGPPAWSADGKMFAFANIASTSVELWVGDAATGVLRKAPGVALNPMFGDDFQWFGGSHTLIVKLVLLGLARSLHLKLL